MMVHGRQHDTARTSAHASTSAPSPVGTMPPRKRSLRLVMNSVVWFEQQHVAMNLVGIDPSNCVRCKKHADTQKYARVSHAQSDGGEKCM